MFLCKLAERMTVGCAEQLVVAAAVVEAVVLSSAVVWIQADTGRDQQTLF